MTRIYIGMVLMASLRAPTAALAVEPAQRRDAEGFSLTAVVRVLREAAQGSPPIANALKNASLL